MVECVFCTSPLVFWARIEVPGLPPSGDAQYGRTGHPVVHAELERAANEYMLVAEIDVSEVPNVPPIHPDFFLKFRFSDIVKERRVTAEY